MSKTRKASLTAIIDRLGTLEGAVHEISLTVSTMLSTVTKNGNTSNITKLLTIIFTIITSWLGVITYLILRR